MTSQKSIGFIKFMKINNIKRWLWPICFPNLNKILFMGVETANQMSIAHAMYID